MCMWHDSSWSAFIFQFTVKSHNMCTTWELNLKQFAYKQMHTPVVWELIAFLGFRTHVSQLCTSLPGQWQALLEKLHLKFPTHCNRQQPKAFLYNKNPTLSKNVPHSVSFVVYYMYMIFYRKKAISLYGASPYCLFPGWIITWAWSLAEGQYMVSWLLTGAPRTKILTK